MACVYILTLYMPAICEHSALTPEWIIRTSIQQKVRTLVLVDD